MKRLFARCPTLRRRFQKHELTPSTASKYGAFDCDNSVIAQSYHGGTVLWEQCGKASSLESNSEVSSSASIAVTGGNWQEKTARSFHPKKHWHISGISAKAANELSGENQQKIICLLNRLYADEFMDDMFLLEIVILFTRKEESESQESSRSIIEQEDDPELEEWINTMTEKINGGKSDRADASACPTRIPGPVGRPVFGGGCMSEWLHGRSGTALYTCA